MGLCSFANLSGDSDTSPTCCMSGIVELDKSTFHKLGDSLQGKRPLLLKKYQSKKSQGKTGHLFPILETIESHDI